MTVLRNSFKNHVSFCDRPVIFISKNEKTIEKTIDYFKIMLYNFNVA